MAAADQTNDGSSRDLSAPDPNWSVWNAAAARPDVQLKVQAIYDLVDRDIQARSPVCDASGRCCRFETYGHRLYVTALEIAVFLRRYELAAPQSVTADAQTEFKSESQSESQPLALPLASTGPLPDACRYQVNGLCSVHAYRPLGCRIFFCDPTAEAWMSEVYEHYLAALRDLHDHLGLHYRYLEWRAGLLEADEHRRVDSAPG